MTIKNRFPDVAPVLNLDFANTKRLDPRITFTRSSTGTYVDEFGVIKTAASNEARFDHDSDGNSLGLLIEESRTNLVTYSEDFSVTYWTKNTSGNGVTPSVTSNNAIAPDGTLTADKIDFSRGTATFPNLSFVSSGSVSTTQGSSYSGSLWIKAATTGDVGKQIVFRHVSNGAGIIYTLTLDWTKIDNTETASSTTGKLSFGLLGYDPPAYGSQTLAETSVSVHVWGAQLEQGSFPTSYIPTSGSTATRSADVASMTGTNFSSWYNQSEGTIITNNTNRNLYGYSYNFINAASGTGGDNIYNYGLGSGIRVGSTNLFMNQSFVTPLISALGYSSTGVSDARNGSLNTNAGSLSMPSNIDMCSLGTRADFSTAYHISSHLSRLTYYDRRLTDAQLQALTL